MQMLGCQKVEEQRHGFGVAVAVLSLLEGDAEAEEYCCSDVALLLLVYVVDGVAAVVVEEEG